MTEKEQFLSQIEKLKKDRDNIEDMLEELYRRVDELGE